MKIGIDGQKLLIENIAGPEVYTYNTVKGFAKVDKKNEYTIYFNATPKPELWKDISQENENFSYKVIPNLLSWTQVGLAFELITHPVDVFFNAKHTIPVIHPKKTRLVSMIHGLEFKINRQFYKNPLKGFIHPFIIWWVLVFSDAIVVPSQATKNSIKAIKWPIFDSKKIKIVTEGVGSIFYKRPREEIQDIRDKYKIGDVPYLIFVSTIQPRKNIPRMVQAFRNVIQNYEQYKDIKLMIAGKLGWLYEESLAAPSKYGVAENTRFLGRVPDDDLPKLLSGAKAFISCSLDEGFGIPLLEAMACETSAIVSDIPAFKELGQNNVTYVNPEKIESIENGILSNLNSDQKDNIENAKKASKNYTWEKGSKELISIFESLIKNF